ncbi:MAG: DsbA family protein [Caldilineaceae bacterium]|nr:DsbA family protein [Caldilineaceae bacterium]
MYRHPKLPIRAFLPLIAFLFVLAGCQAAIPSTTGLLAPQPAEVSPTSASPAPAAAVSTQTDQEILDGIPVGFTDEGYPYRGSPDAPVTVYEYSDYQCPFCQRHVLQTEPALASSFVRTGQARFVFRDFPLDSLHPNAIPASIAANCVAEQGAIPFWRMHDLLFRTQDEWANLPDPADLFVRLAGEAGADVTLYTPCLSDSAIADAVKASLTEGEALGFTGTPSFHFVVAGSGEGYQLVGAQPYDTFDNWFKTIADGGSPVDPAAAQQEAQGQIPNWAIPENWADDPAQPGTNLAGDFWRGSPDAPITVVEFSDFQCPFCQRHTLNTQPILDEQFVDTGDVRWIFKHFPVQSTHPYAFPAAIFAQCVGEQGKFWEAHDALFVRMSEWAGGNQEIVFGEIAAQLEVDSEALASCRADEATLQKVQNDLMEGSQFVQGTPTFVVIYNNQGRLIPGALPADQFADALNQLLAEAKGSE